MRNSLLKNPWKIVFLNWNPRFFKQLLKHFFLYIGPHSEDGAEHKDDNEDVVGGGPAAGPSGGNVAPSPPSEPEPGNGNTTPQTPNIEFKPHPNPAEISGKF